MKKFTAQCPKCRAQVWFRAEVLSASNYINCLNKDHRPCPMVIAEDNVLPLRRWKK